MGYQSGILCLQAVLSKAVSDIRDCSSSTGDTPGLLEGGGLTVQIYVVAAREGRMRGDEMGEGTPKED